jgi:hypothetical protein
MLSSLKGSSKLGSLSSDQLRIGTWQHKCSCGNSFPMDGRAGGRRSSGEPAGHRAVVGYKGGGRSHTAQDDCSGVCQLRRVPFVRSPSKRRRFGEIRSSLDSSASLLHGRAGRRHCSPAHPVSPAGNPVQTHTKAPSGPVRILEPISLCILHGIH